MVIILELLNLDYFTKQDYVIDAISTKGKLRFKLSS